MKPEQILRTSALIAVCALALVLAPSTLANPCQSSCTSTYFQCVSNADYAWIQCSQNGPSSTCDAQHQSALFQCEVTENQCLQACGNDPENPPPPQPIPGTPGCWNACFDLYNYCIAQGSSHAKCSEELSKCFNFCSGG